MKHGLTKTRLYRIWADMKKRCSSTHYAHYDRYGGRGISVCDEWENDFTAFYKWSIENGYGDSLSIDRINVDGNYEPSNCRWVTSKEQHRNTSKTIWLEHNGEIKPLVQWCEELGVNPTIARDRYGNGHRNFDIIMSKKKLKTNSIETSKQRGSTIKIAINDDSKTISEWAEVLGVPKNKLISWKDRNGVVYLKEMITKILSLPVSEREKFISKRKYKYYYVISKGDERYEFDTEKGACDFVGVRQASVGRCYREGRKCNGWKIQKYETLKTGV